MEIILAGLVIGSLFIVISKATREGLGYGDSWLMCILGGYLGIWNMLELLVMTWMLTAVVAGIILARSRFKKRTSIPLVPLITVGYIAVWLTEIMMATNAKENEVWMKRNYKIYKNEGKLAKIRTMELNGMFTVEMAYIAPFILMIFFLSIMGIFCYS